MRKWAQFGICRLNRRACADFAKIAPRACLGQANSDHRGLRVMQSCLIGTAACAGRDQGRDPDGRDDGWRNRSAERTPRCKIESRSSPANRSCPSQLRRFCAGSIALETACHYRSMRRLPRRRGSLGCRRGPFDQPRVQDGQFGGHGANGNLRLR